MDIRLNAESEAVRGQEIRLHCLAFASGAGGVAMGRMGGPLEIAREFEKWVLAAGRPEADKPAEVATVTTAPGNAETGGEGDMIEVKEPVPASGGPASLKQAAGKK